MEKNSDGRYVVYLNKPNTEPAKEPKPKQKPKPPGPFKRAKSTLHRFWRCERQRDLSPAARCAWLWLWSIMDSDHKARSSYATIGHMCGYSVRTSKRAVSELIDSGLLEISKRGSNTSGNKSNIYKVKNGSL